MTHVEFNDLLTDYLDGALAPAHAQELDAHLENCAECRAIAADVRFALEACRTAEDVEPAPWLMPRILRATLGERRPSLAARLADLLRGVFRPQFAYGVSMAVFSISFLLFASGAKMQNMRVQDLNPLGWVQHVDRSGHLLAARATKFYYDLRVVYEVQSLFSGFGSQPAAPAAHAPGDGANKMSFPAPRRLASNSGAIVTGVAQTCSLGPRPSFGEE